MFSDVCELPKDSGPCEAYSEYYYYNKVTDSCDKFVYGGCYGNANRFNTWEDCVKRCRKQEPSNESKKNKAIKYFTFTLNVIRIFGVVLIEQYI